MKMCVAGLYILIKTVYYIELKVSRLKLRGRLVVLSREFA